MTLNIFMGFSLCFARVELRWQGKQEPSAKRARHRPSPPWRGDAAQAPMARKQAALPDPCGRLNRPEQQKFRAGETSGATGVSRLKILRRHNAHLIHC